MEKVGAQALAVAHLRYRDLVPQFEVRSPEILFVGFMQHIYGIYMCVWRSGIISVEDRIVVSTVTMFNFLQHLDPSPATLALGALPLGLLFFPVLTISITACSNPTNTRESPHIRFDERSRSYPCSSICQKRCTNLFGRTEGVNA